MRPSSGLISSGLPSLPLALLLLAACGSNEPLPDPTAKTELLSVTDHLVRASMALRGTRPTVEELRIVEAEPDRLPELVDAYLASPEFGATIRDLHDEALLVGVEYNLPRLAPLDRAGFFTGNASIAEEPLRLIEHVVMNDRPYTEIVTADYTVVDDVAAEFYGLDHDGPPGTWQVSRWTDGRPAAGVLSSTAFYMRHESNGRNYHRGRANAVSKAFLCYDFLNRDVTIDGGIDLSDPDAVAEAVTTNESCASCHQGLDGLAAFFFGVRPTVPNNPDIVGYPIQFYGAEYEDRWQVATGRAPTFFGSPGSRLDDLGAMIADDPRFALCAAKRFYGYFHQTRLSEVPHEEAAALSRELVDSGYDARALARAVVLSDSFRLSHAEDDDAAASLVGLKMVRPRALASMIDDLTGYRWETELDVPLQGARVGYVDLVPDVYGTLAGGINGRSVVEPFHTVNTTVSLLLRFVAAEAAGYVVEADFATESGARRLLSGVEADTTDETRIRGQLAELHYRFYAEDVEPTSPAVDETWALWSGTHTRTGDGVHAWKTTLTAMLQDLRIAYY